MVNAGELQAEARRRLDALAKPPGSLGRLEELAIALCMAQGTVRPVTSPRLHLVWCADYASAVHTSAWPSHVSALVARTLARGGGVSSVWARRFQATTRIVDVGLAHDPQFASAHASIETHTSKVVSGVRDMLVHDALTSEEHTACWANGQAEAERAAAQGVRVLVLGEVGIGNTASAAAIATLVLQLPSEDLVGRGAGADDGQLARKRTAVAGMVVRARRCHKHLTDQLRAVAGAELVAMAGCMQRAAELGVVVILDGALAAAAALLVTVHAPAARRTWLASHRGSEPLHLHALQHLQLRPWLEWDLRLGEGSGALLLLPMLDAAADLMTEVSTLDDALQ
jgi:nicotinate-nucleotide--dimethylbenzimidazole phosphoribosyltransferase